MGEHPFRPPRDTSLPGLGKAVRPEYLRERLRVPVGRLLGEPSPLISGVRVVNFHHKPGVNCRIVYELDLMDGRRLILSGKIHPSGGAAPGRKGTGWRRLSGLNMILRRPAADRSLSPLARLLDPRLASRESGWIFPEAVRGGVALKPGDIHIELRRYRPGRRALVRMEARIPGPAGRIRPVRWLKVYAFPLPSARVAAARRLGGTGSAGENGILMPPVIGTSDDRRVLVSDHVGGIPLLSSLGRSPEKRLIKRTARALRRIHTAPPVPAMLRDPGSELADLESGRRTLAGIDREMGMAAEGILKILRRKAFLLPAWRFGTIHGDFSHEQVLVKRGHIRILDSDRLALGDEHLDLGTFAANAMEAAIAGRISRKTARRWIRILWREYSSLAPGKLHAPGLRWHSSAALLRLAVRPLRRAEPGWRRRGRRILAAASRWLEGGYDFLLPPLPSESRRRHATDRIRGELDMAENGRSRLIPDSGGRLRKIWPSGPEGWMLYYRDDGPAGMNGGIYFPWKTAAPPEPIRFPEDRLMPALKRAMDPAGLLEELGRSGLLDEIGAENPRVTRIRVAGRKPERRCQLEVVLTEPGDPGRRHRIFVKLFRSAGEAAASRDRSQLLGRFLAESKERLFLRQPPVRFLPRLRAVALPRIPGRDFLDRLHERPGPDSAARIARALRLWQSARGIPVRDFTWEEELEATRRWIFAAGRLFPGIDSTLRRRTARLKDRAGEMHAPPPSLIHRDFHDKQVLMHEKKLAILDHDLAARGNPALDAGNFSAHLVLRGLQRYKNPAAYSDLRRKFLKTWLEGYGPEPSRWVEIYTDSALTRLAGVYLLRPRGRDLIPFLLREN